MKEENQISFLNISDFFQEVNEFVLWLFAFLFLMTRGKVRKWLLLFLHYFDSLLFSDVLQLDFLGNLIKWTNQIQICFTIFIAVYTAWIMQVPYSHMLMYIHAESWIVYKETLFRLIKNYFRFLAILQIFLFYH